MADRPSEKPAKDAAAGQQARPAGGKACEPAPLPEARRGRLRLFGALGIALCALFFLPLSALFAYAAVTEQHSHIVLVPVVAAYLVMLRRSQWPLECRSSPYGAAAFVLAGAAFLGARLWVAPENWSGNDLLSLSTASFVCFLIAIGFAVLGGAWLRSVAFPAAFLFLLVPLPDHWVEWLETRSKLASADAVDFLFSVMATPVLRDGTTFALPGIVLEVAQECSGIRSSLVLFITSLVAANLFLRSTWRRVLLVLFVIPLGVIRNGVRILIIGRMCIEGGPEMIHSWVHRQGGPIFFAASLVPFFLLLWWLRAGERKAAAGRRRGDQGGA